METKSRYEVLSDLEAKKRELIKERDSLSGELDKKKQTLKVLVRNGESLKVVALRDFEDLDRKKDTLEREKEDFLLSWNRRVKDIEVERRELERRKNDNEVINNRKIEDCKTDIELFEKTIEDKKNTINDLIKSVDESLNRFQTQTTSQSK